MYNPEMILLEHERQDQRPDRFFRFLEEECSKYKEVIYVMGNHEHYHGTFTQSVAHLREKFAYLSNLHVLDREMWTLDDVTFIGGTLWTDMNNHDALTLYHMRTMMNDFRIIWHGDKGRKFSPEDSVTEHVKMKQYIDVVTQEQPDKKFVVCGHHSPSRLSTHPMYADDTVMNGGYSSDLSEFILDHPQIKLWTHGHTHHEFDYQIGETRVVCNPRGYVGYEQQAQDFKLKFVDI